MMDGPPLSESPVVAPLTAVMLTIFIPILHESITRFPSGTLSGRMMLNIRSASDILEHGRLLLEYLSSLVRSAILVNYLVGLLLLFRSMVLFAFAEHRGHDKVLHLRCLFRKFN
jgi:hypothetical protein